MNYVKIEGHNGYVRDKKSGAVLNLNKSEIEAALKEQTSLHEENCSSIDQSNIESCNKIGESITEMKNTIAKIENSITNELKKLNAEQRNQLKKYQAKMKTNVSKLLSQDSK